MPKKPAPSASTPKRDRDYFEQLSEAELDQIWAERAKRGITPGEEVVLRHVLRDRKGFKPVTTFTSICQRCNLPADNCACHR